MCVWVGGSWSSTNSCTPGEAPISSQRRPQDSVEAGRVEEEEEAALPHHVDAHHHPANRQQRLQDGKTAEEPGASALASSLHVLRMTMVTISIPSSSSDLRSANLLHHATFVSAGSNLLHSSWFWFWF